MEKFNSNSQNQDNANAWEMPAEKTLDQLMAEYDELMSYTFEGKPEDYADMGEYLEKKYLFDERQAYEQRKLEDKIYEARVREGL